MNGLWTLLAIALLPAVGFQLGVGLAMWRSPPPWLLGATLHAAAGIALAVAMVELAPRSLTAGPVVPTLLAFGAGGGLSIILKWLAGKARRLTGTKQKGALAVYSVAAADVFSDGLMTGAGGAVATSLALLLGASQVVANVPNGFAGGANFLAKGGRRSVALTLAAAMVVPAITAAAIGWFVLRGRSEELQAIALAAVVGLLVVATVEDLIPEADKPGSPRRASTAAVILGFIGMAALARLL